MAKIMCPSCKSENEASDSFCRECGTALSSATSGDKGKKEMQEQVVAPAPGISAGTGKPVPAGKLGPRLVVKRTGRIGHEFAIDQEVMNIGRWDADSGIFPEIDLAQDDPGPYVSRKHAKIVLKDGAYFIEDLGSTSGTYVNKGARLVPGSPQKLQDGDEIIVGRTFLQFKTS
jgi:pSer/pThr/pTyr-binding forkhead associated (FHA) protein